MTGNKKLDLVLLLLNGVITLGSAGAVFYAHNMIKKTPTNQEGEFSDLKENAQNSLKIVPLKLPKNVLNLYTSKKKLRFLEVEINIEPFYEKHKPLILDAEAIINDILIQTAGNMSYEEINSVTGKILFESRIRNSINTFLTQKIIKKIYFSKFIAQ